MFPPPGIFPPPRTLSRKTHVTEPTPQVDLLAIAAHRDDVELLVGGTMGTSGGRCTAVDAMYHFVHPCSTLS